MQRRSTPTTRQAPSLEPARRRIAVRLILQTLHGFKHGDPCLSRIAASLERRRALWRQPWRQPVLPNEAPLSILEKIRRFEARARAH
jgi:hypothetical protein